MRSIAASVLEGPQRLAAALGRADAGGSTDFGIGGSKQRLAAHHVGTALREHDRRRVEVGVRLGREDRAVDDPEATDAAHLLLPTSCAACCAA